MSTAIRRTYDLPRKPIYIMINKIIEKPFIHDIFYRKQKKYI
ncbi:hypothetical protein HMPREF9089_01032 [Eubacterium brachy ATCC 33089]|nr:hypothetical protein HMPREF9089_01032 [Eubacterium brachy ATCC 33089]